ncbi:hypothetical protein GCM10010485_55070 [Streptosporangium carneum]
MTISREQQAVPVAQLLGGPDHDFWQPGGRHPRAAVLMPEAFARAPGESAERAAVRYEFDDLDWQAVETGLPDTDDERQKRWYGYPLVGTVARLDLKLARAVGGTEVSVEVYGAADDVLRAQVRLVCDMAASYDIGRA